MKQIVGSQSIEFNTPPYIVSSANIAGCKEGEGPLGPCIDCLGDDDLFGETTWELAEGALQKHACEGALEKANLKPEDIRYLYGGDLLRQGIATSIGVGELQIPLFGLYGACSTSGEALGLCAMAVAGGYGDYMMAVTSSHFGSAEKEFRFPLAYANQRALSTQWTVTGSGAFIVGTKKSKVKITGMTVGKIVDMGLKDPQNMGACMAPAAKDTIMTHLKDMKRTVQDYDHIITGDLGYIGSEILVELLQKEGMDIAKVHLDCGKLIFDKETQSTNAGGSGCGCAAVTLSSFILPKVESGEWKRILFVPTGALMSTISFNEGESVPGIAHGIVIEQA